MLILFSRPTPATAPKASQSRSRPAREHAHQDPADERPEEEVEGVHRVVAAERQGDRGEAGRDSREGARERTAAQRPGDPAGEPDGRGDRERRHHAQREVRLPGNLRHEPRDPAHERRVVDVAPAGMPAAGDVVELVPEDAVAGEKREVEEEDARGRAPLRQALRQARATTGRSVSLHRGLPLHSYGGARRLVPFSASARAGQASSPASPCGISSIARVAEPPRAAVARPVGGPEQEVPEAEHDPEVLRDPALVRRRRGATGACAGC